MTVDRLPHTVQTLYAELLDHCQHSEAEQAVRGLPPGSFVSKQIKGSRYWYLQVSIGAQKRQVYLGPESEALLEWMRRVRVGREALEDDEEVRRRLAGMLTRGGASRQPRSVLSVLGLLADLGVFRSGGVVVGTQAFQAYGNLLGVRLSSAAQRTQDIDIAQDPEIAVALGPDAPSAIAEELLAANLGLLPVPGLDPRQPSTSFKVRGGELRVDFLTPSRRRDVDKPRQFSRLGIAAQPLYLLDYLIEEPTPAVVLGGSALLVRVPDPARFALHKLWTAEQRPVSQRARAAKDRTQAWELIEVLAVDRPDDLRRAGALLARRRRAWRAVRAALSAGSNEQRAWAQSAGLPVG